MKTWELIREIYIDAFKSIEEFMVRYFFKFFFWFCFISFMIVLYAFIYRVATGFPFD